MSSEVRSTPGGTATPASESTTLRCLSPRSITLWRLTGAVRAAFFLAVAVLADWLIELPVRSGALAFLVVVAALLHIVLVPPMRYRAWRYALRGSDLYLRQGVLFRTTSIVPHARIQHVDTRHGPLDRWLGLAAVVVYTAGTRGAIIPIPALEAEQAEALRDRLASLSGAGDAV